MQNDIITSGLFIPTSCEIDYCSLSSLTSLISISSPCTRLKSRDVRASQSVVPRLWNSVILHQLTALTSGFLHQNIKVKLCSFLAAASLFKSFLISLWEFWLRFGKDGNIAEMQYNGLSNMLYINNRCEYGASSFLNDTSILNLSFGDNIEYWALKSFVRVQIGSMG